MFGKRYSLETLARRGYRLVQRGAARGLDFSAEPTSLRRGDSVSITVQADAKAKAATLEAGLICTETYATFIPQSRLGESDRTMMDTTAYEEWLTIGPEGAVSFTVPADGPYSYDGKHLMLTWRVSVRQRRRGVDAVRAHEIRVNP